MTALFGGGGNSEARKAAEESRRAQQIANEKQMVELRRQDDRTGATRRNPRGRRLFVSDAAEKSNIS